MTGVSTKRIDIENVHSKKWRGENLREIRNNPKKARRERININPKKEKKTVK